MESIPQAVKEARAASSEAVILLDPQSYLQTLPRADLGHVEDYPFFLPSLQSDLLLTPRQKIEWVKATVDFQLGLDVTYVLSPTMYLPNLNSEPLFASVDLAAETLDYMRELGQDESRVLISLCLNYHALADTRSLNSLLNRLTGMTASAPVGFYIVVDANPDLEDPYVDRSSLAALLQVCYGLGTLNEHMVHVAFTGYLGLLLQAVGATSTSSGWYTKEKRFCQRDCLPREGGQAAVDRYSSSKLMASVLVSPDLLNYVRLLGPDEVLTGDPSVNQQPIVSDQIVVPWHVRMDCAHFWQDMTLNISLLDQLSSVPDRLNLVAQWLSQAKNRWETIRSKSLPFKVQTYGIDTMLGALDDFRVENEI
jgi:hypothetical protein